MTTGDAPKVAPKKVNLALQGGGAHGAFTWGALDRLLEEDDIAIEGVSAASAGAMNGAMLTTGLKVGGRAEARRRLAAFWGAIRDGFPLNQPPWSYWLAAFSPLAAEGNPALALTGAVASLVSPYQFNMSGVNPLRAILEDLIDFSAVCRMDEPRLFVAATDVRSGRAKIFAGDEISIDALLASACLPFLYQAVRIDGRDYWDGGYTGNPPLWPLIYNCESEDVILVQINPIDRDETPRDAQAIHNRVNEISFNSNLLGELRAIDTICRLVGEGKLPPERYKRMRIHPIEDEETMRTLSAATKLAPAARLLERLFEAGRDAAATWLALHKSKLGVQSSVDLRARYL